MIPTKRHLITAALVSILTVAASSSAVFAAPKQTTAAASWDGNWTGKWNGKSSARVVIKDNKVEAYYFNGTRQTVGATKVSGKTLSFGSGYSVNMTLTGANSSKAIWRGDGVANADLTR